jgi:hypothetical protein
VRSLCSLDNYLFALTDYGLEISGNAGDSWNPVDNQIWSEGEYPIAICTDDNGIYAGTSSGNLYYQNTNDIVSAHTAYPEHLKDTHYDVLAEQINDRLSVKLSKSLLGQTSIQLYATNGSLIYSGDITFTSEQTQLSIPIKHSLAGCFVLKVASKTNSHFYRIFIQ